MKNTLLLIFVLSLGLIACESKPQGYERPDPIQEEALVEEEMEVLEEDTTPLCENDSTWDESIADSRSFLAPTEELYARKVYLIEDWGIQFEIPGKHSEYNAFKEGDDKILFSLATDPGCTGREDTANAYISRITDYGASTSEFREDHLAGNELLSFEFSIDNQTYIIVYLTGVQEDLMLGLLETLEKAVSID